MQSSYKRNIINKSGISPRYSSAGTFFGNWKFSFLTNTLLVCPRSFRILDMPNHAAISMANLFSLMEPATVRQLVREFRLACAIGNGLNIQVKVLTPAGNVKWLRITGQLFYGKYWGTAELMVGAIEDITQQVIETNLGFAIVNHELRNPMTIIKLNTQFLVNRFSTKTDALSLRLLNNIEMHIDGMHRLVEEYMTTSVDENRSPCLNLTVFDLNDLVENITCEMKIVYGTHHFYKNSSEPIWVTADKYKIIQALLNYITNAVNFSPVSSKVKIELISSNDFAWIMVTDQGIGIPKDQEQHIFQKFYSCRERFVRQKNSKGLGLHLVKKIIEAHGGKVSAEKGQLCGAVFSFSLPVNKNESLSPKKVVVG